MPNEARPTGWKRFQNAVNNFADYTRGEARGAYLRTSLSRFQKENPQYNKSFMMRRLSDLLIYEGPSWEGWDHNKEKIIRDHIETAFLWDFFPAKGEERIEWFPPDIEKIYGDFIKTRPLIPILHVRRGEAASQTIRTENRIRSKQIETTISIFPSQKPIYEWLFKFIVLSEFSQVFREKPHSPWLLMHYEENKDQFERMWLPKAWFTDVWFRPVLDKITDRFFHYYLFVRDLIYDSVDFLHLPEDYDFVDFLHLPEEAVRLIKENTDLINQMDGAFR